MLLGHLAIPIILKNYLPLQAGPLVAGTLMPDVVDKGLQQVDLAVNGRSWAHSVFGLTISTGVVSMIFGKTPATSWAAGYLTHLLADADGFIPWLHPFASYEFYPTDKNLWQKVRQARLRPLELILIGWALLIIFRKS